MRWQKWAMRKVNGMKLKLMIRLLLLALFMAGLAPVAQAFYNPSSGRWLSRDPIGERGGVNLYGFVRNNPVSLVDLLGLRDITAEEQKVLDELQKFADSVAGNKSASTYGNGEYAKAIAAVIGDIKALIASIKGEEDPATLAMGLKALTLWADKNTALSYDKTDAGVSTCNIFVADVIGDAGFETKLIRRPSRLWLDFRIPGTTEWHQDKTLGAFKVTWRVKVEDGKGGGATGGGKKGKTVLKVQLDQPIKGKGGGRFVNLHGISESGTVPPALGHIISYPGHIGIYLGRGLYMSSTTDDPTGIQGRGAGINLKFINNNENQLYRSPE